MDEPAPADRTAPKAAAQRRPDEDDDGPMPGVLPTVGHEEMRPAAALSARDQAVLDDLKEHLGEGALESTEDPAKPAGTGTAAVEALAAQAPRRKPRKSYWYVDVLLALLVAAFVLRDGLPTGWRLIFLAVPFLFLVSAANGYRKDKAMAEAAKAVASPVVPAPEPPAKPPV